MATIHNVAERLGCQQTFDSFYSFQKIFSQYCQIYNLTYKRTTSKFLTNVHRPGKNAGSINLLNVGYSDKLIFYQLYHECKIIGCTSKVNLFASSKDELTITSSQLQHSHKLDISNKKKIKDEYVQKVVENEMQAMYYSGIHNAASQMKNFNQDKKKEVYAKIIKAIGAIMNEDDENIETTIETSVFDSDADDSDDQLNRAEGDRAVEKTPGEAPRKTGKGSHRQPLNPLDDSDDQLNRAEGDRAVEKTPGKAPRKTGKGSHRQPLNPLGKSIPSNNKKTSTEQTMKKKNNKTAAGNIWRFCQICKTRRKFTMVFCNTCSTHNHQSCLKKQGFNQCPTCDSKP